MKLQPGTTYMIMHEQYKGLDCFITCLGEMSHVTIYNTIDNYYRFTADLERVLNNNGFKIEPVLE